MRTRPKIYVRTTNLIEQQQSLGTGAFQKKNLLEQERADTERHGSDTCSGARRCRRRLGRRLRLEIRPRTASEVERRLLMDLICCEQLLGVADGMLDCLAAGLSWGRSPSPRTRRTRSSTTSCCWTAARG